MTIVFLTRRFWPDIGGVEKHIECISKELIRNKHKVTVVSENTARYKEHELAKRIEIFRIPIKDEFKKKFEIWSWLWQNRSIIKSADIVHIHDVSYWYLPFKLLYPKKKFYITFHGYSTYPIRKKEQILRKCSEYLSSGNIIVGSFIKKWFGTKADYIIYGGVDLPKKQMPVRFKKQALYIGRLEKQTGIEMYAQAVRLLQKRALDFKFTVVGNGEYSIFLKDFDLHKAEEETRKYYENTNFVFASGYLTILEAMANRRLVFAVYDNDLKKDYLKMTPFWRYIILSDNPSDLANKLEYYLKNQNEADEITNQAYEWVKNNTWENVTSMYLDLWQKN